MLLQFLKGMRQQVAGKDPEKDSLRDQVAALFKKLCYKLDSLSNFAFTPKPVLPDLTVRFVRALDVLRCCRCRRSAQQLSGHMQTAFRDPPPHSAPLRRMQNTFLSVNPLKVHHTHLRWRVRSVDIREPLNRKEQMWGGDKGGRLLALSCCGGGGRGCADRNAGDAASY